LRAEIPDYLRRFVAERAGNRCEYCLLHENDSYSPHQIDHVISRKHGGSSKAENLAYACVRCNAWKGSDIGSLDGGEFVPLFNPRKDRWREHFKILGFVFEPLTPEGRVTARLLRLNLDKRVSERRAIGISP
jgi:5-methylcytosine-specific restriction endonuclease McrA